MCRGCDAGAPGAQFFSKCGIIKEGDDKRPRIKIYRDRATGMPKGDGLVTYLKEPSVRPPACSLSPMHTSVVLKGSRSGDI